MSRSPLASIIGRVTNAVSQHGSSKPGSALLGARVNASRPQARCPISASRTYASTSSVGSKPQLNVPTSAGGPQAPLEYCSSLVQRLDPEAWLCSYFWPKRERAWFLAWRAFNLELHLVSTTVTQPALASIRFQFWRDALKAIFTKDTAGGAAAVPQHPVAVLLAETRRERPIQKYYLSQMIDTRAKNLSLPPSSPTLESHLTTHGPLHTSLLLGPLPLLLPPTHASTSGISHTLSHLSTLLCITSLLRSLPILVSKRSLNIPADVRERHGVVEEDVLRNGAAAKGVRDACYEIGTRGMDELITARRETKGAGGRVEPKAVRPLFLSAIPAERYLKRLEGVDFDVFHPDLQKQDWKLAPTIWWRSQTGKL
ncbi:isoprenoid synthase domain-containing protein [Dioszegia hungarica]|uniref:Isoprenoid synthase domain-containing protein n=1 Tax=Dioszegia hungarica TaxID=4972 RepID=A0AA38H5Z5_9TREE|nr:isoprenoid synthase domain-containing protein [Dioszegia hungarica]KAI9633401.1 isoprenoid synthase domain-containing protein [Dioszegia hungarica]